MKTETLIEFIEKKIADCEKTILARDQAYKLWLGGTDKSWKAVGCGMTKAQRLDESARQGRIAIKYRLELELLKGVLESIKGVVR